MKRISEPLVNKKVKNPELAYLIGMLIFIFVLILFIADIGLRFPQIPQIGLMFIFVVLLTPFWFIRSKFNQFIKKRNQELEILDSQFKQKLLEIYKDKFIYNEDSDQFLNFYLSGIIPKLYELTSKYRRYTKHYYKIDYSLNSKDLNQLSIFGISNNVEGFKSALKDSPFKEIYRKNIFITKNLNYIFHDEIYLMPRNNTINTLNQSQKLFKVKSNCEEFNKNWTIFTKNKMTFETILNTKIIASLNKLQTLFDNSIYVCFKNNQINIFVIGFDLFKLDQNPSIKDDKQLEKLSLIISLLECLE